MESLKLLRRSAYVVCLALLCGVVLSDCVVGGQTPCLTAQDCPTSAPVCVAQICVACQKDSDCPEGKRCVLVALRSQCAVGLPFDAGGGRDTGVQPDTSTPPDTRRSETPPIDNSEPRQPPGDAGQEQSSPEPRSDAPDGREDVSETPQEASKDEPPSACQAGESRDCYTGDPTHQGRGECAAGKEACVNGQWGPCVGSVLPTKEVCDGRDNDCDGEIDEGNPGGGSDCDSGQPGLCSQGTERCRNGKLSCVANSKPVAETCDGKDNDCDGSVDNGNPDGGGNCSTTGKGECKVGTERCQSGKLACVANNKPTKEACDGKDNDCDGSTDEGNPGGGAACSTTGKGECKAGTRRCQNAKIVCVANKKPVAETCDGKDNDCDGSVDEGNPGGGAACSTTGKGECKAGTRRCQNAALVCVANKKASAEVCDGKDNDCDGSIDEGIASKTCHVIDSANNYCFPGTSACSGGKTVCNKGGSALQCATNASCGVCGAGVTCITIFTTIKLCRKTQ